MLPPSDSGDAAWNVMAEEKRRMAGLGILDEHGNVITDAIPDDMKPTSQTSVET